MSGDLTTIQISKMTRDQLRVLGRKGETYDQVLNRLIELARSRVSRRSRLPRDPDGG